MNNTENIARIRAVYNALEELALQVVFIGGATVALYADRPAAESRPTEDVDIVVEIASYNDYTAIEEKLRQKGFVNDIESGVICRYIVGGVIVDVMPTNEEVLGFSNPWYLTGFRTAFLFPLSGTNGVLLFKPEYFLASKLVAYDSRGGGDGRWSSDFEDIVFVLNNRTTLWQELRQSEQQVASYLKDQFRVLLQNPYVDEWIAVHLEQAEQKRVRTILGEMELFVKE